MSGRIRLLPDDVVNQIAAGEVVERPASVLKELLENAVDAGAKRIEAAVSVPFPYAIRVSDDGSGMTPDEASLSVRRHTTSKIVDASDLDGIVTYGFRGEALPSIAAVSRLRILTRTPDAAEGFELLVEGGAVTASREAGAPPGTTVEVTDLFWNVPARRKFLKSPRTELAHLWEAFHAVAIPREGIAFAFSDGRATWRYEAGESRTDRARREAGEEAAYLVAVASESPFFRISGLAGLPHLARMSGAGIRLFVNGRHFRDRGMNAALREAYRGILPPDRLPVAVLFIECAPEEVDVNVHPGKTEVRFRYARDLHELVRHAVGAALGEGGERRTSPPYPAAPGTRPDTAPPPPGDRSTRAWTGAFPFFPAGPPEEPRPASPGDDPLRAGFGALRPVGQVLGTFIVCEGGGDVVIVDQHAADERILFSRLKDSMLGKGAPVQRWLVPQVVTMPAGGPDEKAAIRRFLEEVGFTFEAFGGETLKITGGPAILGAFDVQAWWSDVLDFLEEQEATPKGIFDADRELWRMACHGAVRGGKVLEREGMRALLLELDRAVAAHSCPHGRPVWVRISGLEMDRMFRRT